ncbi:hypothetical protein ACFWZT_31015 [Streptomyces alboflavus]|uniref:hypothetical protein n=1 Tax=Streptomyces alboflavus TaxID=67267 RepID=UPI00369DF212
MTAPTATATETIIRFIRHLAEPGCCEPPPPNPRVARRSPLAAKTPLVGRLRAADLAAIADLGLVGHPLVRALMVLKPARDRPPTDDLHP